jgi:4'-phosphopantetheinyl transferase
VQALTVHPGVGVWLVDLDTGSDSGEDAMLLSPDEAARAARFVFERHRRRFTAGRAALRRLLAAEVGANPGSLVFAYGPAGKPALTGHDDGLRFNVSHSDQFALVAMTRLGAVGIDIEKTRSIDDVMRLAQTAFSDNELAELRSLPADALQDAFFAGWTRKEAYIKARGDGLGSLGDFDVSLAPHEPVRVKRAVAGAFEASRWTLVSLAPVDGYAGALCVETARR